MFSTWTWVIRKFPSLKYIKAFYKHFVKNENIDKTSPDFVDIDILILGIFCLFLPVGPLLGHLIKQPMKLMGPVMDPLFATGDDKLAPVFSMRLRPYPASS